jgi:hypothetical protein
MSGSAETGSKHGQLILFESLTVLLISVLTPQGNDIMDLERTCLNKDETKYFTANQV